MNLVPIFQTAILVSAVLVIILILYAFRGSVPPLYIWFSLYGKYIHGSKNNGSPLAPYTKFVS